jgi:hypothetical protein
MTALKLRRRGHYYIQGIGLITVPALISRNEEQARWYLNSRLDVEQHSYSDSAHGGALGSLRKVVREYVELIDHPMQKLRFVRTKESDTKAFPLQMAGVCYRRSGRYEYFVVSNPLGSPERVPVNNDWDAALAHAKALRQDFVWAYMDKYRFDMKNLYKQLGLRGPQHV